MGEKMGIRQHVFNFSVSILAFSLISFMSFLGTLLFHDPHSFSAFIGGFIIAFGFASIWTMFVALDVASNKFKDVVSAVIFFSLVSLCALTLSPHTGLVRNFVVTVGMSSVGSILGIFLGGYFRIKKHPIACGESE